VAAFGVYRTLATPTIEGYERLLSANSGLRRLHLKHAESRWTKENHSQLEEPLT
jgi:hypothetical protein